MPHCILEYSDNIVDRPDFRTFFSALHELLAATGEINLDQIKSRVRVAGGSYIGSGDARNAFVYLQFSLLSGRSLELRQELGQKILKMLEAAFPKSRTDLNCSITVEVREMERLTHFRATKA